MTTPNQGHVRTWFNDHGWQLEPAELRSALEERGADTDVIVELLDEGADRRRARPVAAPDDTRRPPSNGAAAGPRLRDPDRGAPGLVPPQNLEAEESVLGAMLLAPGACRAVREILGETGHDFYRESHARIYRAALHLLDRGVDVNPITLTDALDKTGELDQIGGRVRLHELGALVPATGNVGHYARIVAELARVRDLIRVGGEIQALGWERPGEAHELLERARQIVSLVEPPPNAAPPPEAAGAGAFILDEPTDLDAIRIWGDDTAIGWAAGEGLMLVGPDGVGKTTLGQQIALARAGLRRDVLNMRVETNGRRVLYIAADRPRQAARSLRRMVTDTERDQLDAAITVWRGPLPQMLNEDRTILTRLAKQFDAGTVIVDSLKDVATDVATDEAGGRVASSFQHLIASGTELLVMHHPRKTDAGGHRKPRELADVYGSRLIFGVFGSIIMLWGEAGDVLVELRHLKQPIDELGPWNLIHDHQHGKTSIEHGTDLLDIILRTGTKGATASQAAATLYRKETPSRAEIHRVRGRLDRLTDADKLVKMPPLPGVADDGAHRYLFNGPAEALR